MRHALTTSRPTRRLAAVLAALLCTFAALGPLAVAGSAQTLIAPPQTKQEAEEAREAARASTDTGDDGGIGIEVWLGVLGLVAISGAVVYMVRDSGNAVGGGERAAPERAFTPSTTRGAPKTMFDGDDRPGGQVGKRKKRAQGKRQKQARRANRPR